MENTNLQRKQQKIFAGNTTITDEQIAVFGSKTKTGTMQFSLDPDSIQTESWGEGWQGATVLEQAPFEEDFNAVGFVDSYNIAYLLQKGIPEYSENTTYFKGSICLVINNDKPTLYYSKTDNNTGNNPATDSTNWANLYSYISSFISGNFALIDGSNATFDNLSSTAKGNISSFVGWEKISEFEIDNVAEIEFTNLNDGYQHKFKFINITSSVNTYMFGVLGNSNGYINSGYSCCLFGRWSDVATQWIIDSVGYEDTTNLLITSNHNNYWYLSNVGSYVDFTIKSNLSVDGNQFFEFNSMLSSPQQSDRLMIANGNGMLLGATGLDRLKFYLSSGNFTSGIVKHYIMK